MNYCLTYFRVDFAKNFDLKVFAEQLNLSYETLLENGTDQSLMIGYNEVFNIDCNEMIRETLKDLWGKEAILVELKEKYQLKYYLERVPHLFANKQTPNLNLSLDADIIEFLYKSETIDDLDYFVFANSD